MGWPKRKTADYTDMFDAPVVPGTKANWVKEVTQVNLLAQWSESLVQVEELFKERVLYYSEKQREMLKTLHELKAEFLRIDRQLLTVEESVILYDVIHKEIPALVYRLGVMKSTRGSYKKNHEDDYFDLQDKLEQLVSSVSTVRAKADAQKLTRFKNLNPGAAETNLTNLVWPEFQNLPKKVQSALDQLQQLWLNQKDQTHTVEDEYLLERIVTDYIPSSVQLYLPFIPDKIEMESVARESLITQLELIRNHLEKVSENNFNERMRTVNAQTEFLKDRFNNS